MRLTRTDAFLALLFFTMACVSFYGGLMAGALNHTVMLRSACDVQPSQRVKLKPGFYAEFLR